MDTCAVRGGHVGSWHAKVLVLLFFRQDSRPVTLEFYKCRAFCLCPLLFLRSSLLEEALGTKRKKREKLGWEVC